MDVTGHTRAAAVVIHDHLEEIRILREFLKVLLCAVIWTEGFCVLNVPTREHTLPGCLNLPMQ